MSTSQGSFMGTELSREERAQLNSIATASARNEKFEPDPTLLASLVKKGMVRTRGNAVRLTEQGLKALNQP